MKSPKGEIITDAQLHSARVLTDLLRSKYSIPAANCTTHSQVSVNPENFGVGAHTDWSAGFPYEQLGLPDNYSVPLPSVAHFGFDFDGAFLAVSDSPLRNGLLAAMASIRREAEARKISQHNLRGILHEKYKSAMEALAQTRKGENL